MLDVETPNLWIELRDFCCDTSTFVARLASLDRLALHLAFGTTYVAGTTTFLSRILRFEPSIPSLPTAISTFDPAASVFEASTSTADPASQASRGSNSALLLNECMCSHVLIRPR